MAANDFKPKFLTGYVPKPCPYEKQSGKMQVLKIWVGFFFKNNSNRGSMCRLNATQPLLKLR